MPRTAVFLLLCLSLPLRAFGDPLWQKAVEISRANKAWTFNGAGFRIELLDDKGGIQETFESWYRFSPGADGAMAMEVVRSARNGEDTTAKDRDAQNKRNADARRRGGSQPFGMGDDPFDPALQGSVEARPRGDTRVIAARECALYEFRLLKKDKSVLSGTAWLDIRTGAPVEASYTAAPLPRGVFEMRTTMRYGPGPRGDGWLTGVSVEGVGGILFLRKSFRVMVTLEGFQPSGAS